MTDTGANKASPVIRISIVSAIGDKKNMSFETYVDQLTPVKVMNGLTDRIMSVADRQVAKYEIIDLQNLLKREENLLEGMKGDLVRVDADHAEKREAAMSSGTVRNYKLNPQDKQARQNIVTNIQNRTKFIETLKEDIVSRQEKVAAGEAGE